MQLTYQQIHVRLQEIHEEILPISPEQWEEADKRGEYNPCGCQLCLLMQDVFMADMDKEEV